VQDDWRSRVPHLIATGRIVFGLGLMATPTAGARVYLGAEAKRPSVRFASRLFGSRDVALGVVLLQALRENRPEAVNRALVLGAGCDAWDALTALRSRDLPIWGRMVVVALGSTFAGLGLAAALTPDADPTGSTGSGAPASTVSPA